MNGPNTPPAGPTPPGGWPPRRVAALVLTLGLAGIAAYSLSQGILGTLPVLVLGIVLGTTYVWRGGSLSDWAYRIGTGRRGGRSITRDDDPSNLPAKVYLPVLLGALLLAALLFYFGRTK